MKWLLTSVLFLFMPLFSDVFAQDPPAEEFYTVSGVVRDQASRRVIPFVDISVPGTNIGTVTNQDGYFLLKVGKNVNFSEVLLSCMGYTNIRIPVNKSDILNGQYFLSLGPNILEAAVAEGWDATRLVEEAVRRIKANYTTSPTLLTGFYRETAQKRSRFINVSEAVMSIYKSSYDDVDVNRDRVQILKGRQLVSTKPSDTLGVRILGGPNISIYLDVVKNTDLLFDDEARSMVQFRMEQPTVIDERSQYVVSFIPIVEMPYALHYGKLYIDRQTMAFTRAEFYMDMSSTEKATQAILRKKPAGMRFKPEVLSVLVNYKQQDGKTYLSYIRNEIKFSCDWRRRLFSTNYSAVSEMVVTERKESGVMPISRSSAFGASESLSNRVMYFYDENFWGAYNIIEPTESLESAVSRLIRQQR
ncbi:MAG: carboxypeptidase-like regulatory domain-containing protein [Bacteroidales bacterium]|nr:carboxypeptidase-like regulatory domain-containing protein [Bacteroidales bacterium]